MGTDLLRRRLDRLSLAARAAGESTKKERDPRSPLSEHDLDVLAAILHKRRTEDQTVAEQFARRASDDHPTLKQAAQVLLAVSGKTPSVTVTRFGLTVTFYGTALQCERLERRLGVDITDLPNLGQSIDELFTAERLNGTATDAFCEVIGHLTAGRHRTPQLSELRDGFRVSGWLAWGEPMTASQRAWLTTLREQSPNQRQRTLAVISRQEPAIFGFATELVRELTAQAVSAN